MKTILLTWGTGFLGSHIIEDLRKKYDIVLLKRSHSDTSKIRDFLPEIEYYNIDEVDLESIFQKRRIDMILHTATHYGRTYKYLSDIIESNLFFPMELIDLGIKYGTEAFMNTDTFWDEHIELPIGLKYYALTKKDFLKYARIAIRETASMKFINLKIEHLYGPRDDKQKFLPYILSSLLEKKPSIQLTKGEQKRDFIYVKDAVYAYEIILRNIESTNILIDDYDIGTGETHTIREIVEKAHTVLSSQTELLFGALEYRKGETLKTKADTSKLIWIGWKPVYTLDTWLAYTIDSLQKY